MTHKARFFDGKSTASNNLDLQIEGNSLVGISADGKRVLEWRAEDIIVVHRAKRDEVTTLSSSSDNAVRLYVSQSFYQLINRMIPHRAKIKRRFLQSTKTLGFIIGALTLLPVGIYYSIPFLTTLMLPFVSQKWEQELGDMALKEVRRDTKVCDAKKGRAALNKLFSALNVSVETPPKILVVDEREVNAVALPANTIVVFNGLIQFADSPEELLGVLAHEWGHVSQRHPLKSYIQRTGLSFSMLVFGYAGGFGGAAGVTSALYGLSYSRSMEEEADNIALNLLLKNNISPEGLLAFFKKIGASGDMPGVIPNYFSTHPPSGNRAKLIEKTIKPQKYKQVLTPREWEELKLICK